MKHTRSLIQRFRYRTDSKKRMFVCFPFFQDCLINPSWTEEEFQSHSIDQTDTFHNNDIIIHLLHDIQLHSFLYRCSFLFRFCTADDLLTLTDHVSIQLWKY